ncbi:MAG: hypothetical protein NTV51_11125 [Verrucomicrobia bacterium]|nr:hypothetical protein [Verrucomicrobiota bacterium]
MKDKKITKLVLAVAGMFACSLVALAEGTSGSYSPTGELGTDVDNCSDRNSVQSCSAGFCAHSYVWACTEGGTGCTVGSDPDRTLVGSHHPCSMSAGWVSFSGLCFCGDGF